MSKYLYNGIPLPDINTVWTDKTTYPYAIIFVDENDREVLHISPAPFIYEDPNVNISSGSGSPKYFYDSSGWVEDGTGSGYTGSGVKWTNYDIIDISDNSVYLAASEPVPDNGDFNLKSWLIGFALGLSGKPLPIFPYRREPVAYLYGSNNERLPPLPEVEGYEYAAIEYMDADALVSGGRAARLILSSEPIWTHRGWMSDFKLLGDVLFYGFANDDLIWRFTFSMDAPYPPVNEWVKIGEEHYDERTEINRIANSFIPIWANHEVYYEGYDFNWPAASDPIPVYE